MARDHTRVQLGSGVQVHGSDHHLPIAPENDPDVHDLGPDQGVERISVGRSDYQGTFDVYPTHNDSQYVGLRELVEERDPQRIGINVSERWNHADGLTHNEYLRLADALGPEYSERLTSAEMLAVGWLE